MFQGINRRKFAEEIQKSLKNAPVSAILVLLILVLLNGRFLSVI
jgi:hypothetical protein